MAHDVDLLRVLLLQLEARQTSPRATVMIVLRDEADDLLYLPREVEDGLNILRDLDYIEGPGSGVDGIWLFRKLTRKGIEFLRAARDLDDWEAMKRNRAHALDR